MRMTSDLLFYKLDSEVKDPFRATEGSACFDLHSFLPENSVAKVFISHNEQDTEIRERRVVKGRVQINPTERMLVPTGLVFDIPEGYSVRLHPRSSISKVFLHLVSLKNIQCLLCLLIFEHLQANTIF